MNKIQNETYTDFEKPVFIPLEKVKKLVKVYEEYIELLEEELEETTSFAILKSWESTRIDEGEVLRDNIKYMKEILNL